MIKGGQVQRLARMAGWLGLLALAVLSLAPGAFRPHTFLPARLEHVLAYALTGSTLAIGYGQARSRLFWFVALSAAAALFEVLQIWIPGRSAAAMDALASSSGAALGIFCGALLGRCCQNRLGQLA